MRTLNLSGFQTGDNLNLSVSQGALTAGPVNVPAWGGGGSGGTITIQTHRSEMLCAPDSVRFWVDLSAADFDTPGPTGGEIYDARLHDLIYLWDMGDTVTTWEKPVNVLTAWKNRNVAKGPFVMHMYPEPGTYSPSVLVIEPSSGKTATATLSGGNAITVLDPDDVYPGTATICVNPVGDDDWTGEPTGAAHVNIDYFDFADSYWQSRLGGAAKRWLFKRGCSFDARIQIGSSTKRGVYFGSYGPHADNPTISQGDYNDPDDIIDNMVPFLIGAYEQQGDESVLADLRVSRIDGLGTYNPVTTRSDYRVAKGKTAVWMISKGHANLIMSGCDFSGLQGSFLYCAMSSVAAKENSIHLDDCSMTAFGGQYPLFGGATTNVKSGSAVTGCRFVQTPGAVGSEVQREGSSRAIIRANSPHRYHMRGCDFYHTDQWQHCVKVPETPVENGVLVNIHSCSFEGGNGALVFNGNYADTASASAMVHNIVVDGVAVLANHSSQQPFCALCTGLTIRNSLLVIPSVSRQDEAPIGFIRIISRGTFDPVIIGDAPIRIYNNTMRNDKTTAQCTYFGSFEKPVFVLHNHGGGYGAEFTNIVQSNNVEHHPNLDTPDTVFAPLSSTALWASRDLGYRNTHPWGNVEYPMLATWANGATRTFPYIAPYAHGTMATLTAADFAGSNGKEQVMVGTSGAFATYTLADGEIEVTYGASNISVTNTSGVNWVANGTNALIVHFDMGSTAPISTDTVPPAGSWKDSKPLPGSAALGAATTGNVSYMDILGTTRSAPADKGAWVA